MININKNAENLVKQMIMREEEFKCKVSRFENGTTLIDCGSKVSGSIEAGRIFSEICMGGLSRIFFNQHDYLTLSEVVDEPLIACMASQFAGWSIKVKYEREGEKKKFFALGSGPARALALSEKLFDDLSYRDKSDVAVITLETEKLPSLEVANYIAENCRVKPENLYILTAKTASIVGSIQISARVVETGMHKLHELGFEIEKVKAGAGSAPVAPIAKNDLKAMGRCNDCVLYGGRVFYFADCEDSEIEDVIDKIPSSTSRDYGKPFYDTFKSYEFDFYKVDPLLFSPAEITINNLKTGKVFHAGEVNRKVLRESLGV
ncbi:MAG: methenyltetrahydromethanopterin cyclohydrolase [Candidatus Methanofastidiosia archaeon]